MSKFAIFGSGFGLYGYLPALVDGCEQSIILPERYRMRFNERPDLALYANSVHWVADDEHALQQAEGVVLSLRPCDQVRYIPSCLALSNIKRMILEKPLAPSPSLALSMFDELIISKKAFRIGYNFRYTVWGSMLLNEIHSMNEKGLLTLNWSFSAHHFSHDLKNWKRYHSVGGGIIRFYGIHVIALLAEIGYRDIASSRSFGQTHDEPEKWIAVLTGDKLPNCEIVINSKSTLKKFHVDYRSYLIDTESTVVADLEDPFDTSCQLFERISSDPRVPVLKALSRSLWGDENHEYEYEYEWYSATIDLWRTIEIKTQFEVIKS